MSERVSAVLLVVGALFMLLAQFLLRSICVRPRSIQSLIVRRFHILHLFANRPQSLVVLLAQFLLCSISIRLERDESLIMRSPKPLELFRSGCFAFVECLLVLLLFLLRSQQ